MPSHYVCQFSVFIAAGLTLCFAQPHRVPFPERDGMGETYKTLVTKLQKQVTGQADTYWRRFAFYHNRQPITGSTGSNCEHRSAFFLIWHHVYLGAFEESARLTAGFANFSTPYWNLAANPRFPKPFVCGTHGADPCSLLSEYREDAAYSQKAFLGEKAFVDGLLSTPAAVGDYCPTSVNSILGGLLSQQSGNLERKAHSSVHLESGDTMASDGLAAFDPLFHPFHAGLDFQFLSLLKRSMNSAEAKQSLQCELCQPRENAGTELWLAKNLVIPCAEETDPVTGFPRAKSVSSKCISSAGGGLPYRIVTVREALTNDEFWTTGFAYTDSSGNQQVLKLDPPCKGFNPALCTSPTCLAERLESFSARPAHLIHTPLNRDAATPSVRTPIRSADVAVRALTSNKKKRFTSNYLIRLEAHSKSGKSLGSPISWKKTKASPWITSLDNHHSHDESLPKGQLPISFELDVPPADLPKLETWTSSPDTVLRLKVWRKKILIFSEEIASGGGTRLRIWRRP